MNMSAISAVTPGSVDLQPGGTPASNMVAALQAAGPDSPLRVDVYPTESAALGRTTIGALWATVEGGLASGFVTPYRLQAIEMIESASRGQSNLAQTMAWSLEVDAMTTIAKNVQTIARDAVSAVKSLVFPQG